MTSRAYAELAGPDGKLESDSHETVHITVTPACYVSNLTILPLQLSLHGNVSGPSSLLCAPGVTQPLQQVNPLAQQSKDLRRSYRRVMSCKYSVPCSDPSCEAPCAGMGSGRIRS